MALIGNKKTVETLAKKDTLTNPKKGLAKILFVIGGYFKGSWSELRQVLWPNRKATWSLTVAVLLYTFFFVILIVILDDVFKYLFNLILK